MYFGDEEKDERDPFEVFGELETSDETVVHDEFDGVAEDIVETAVEHESDEEPAAQDFERQEAPRKLKLGFSWAGFTGALAALVWIAGAIGGPISYFGLNGVMTMDPAMQAGFVALAFGPALLFWLAASAAGEALKTRRLATELTRMAQESRSPFEAGEQNVQRLSDTVKTEIETLNDAVSAALDRLAQLETVARRNAALFNDAVTASRDTTEQMSDTLKRERDALVELNGDMRGQTETMAHAVGRQVRLMREASKLVKTELGAAEDALETHLASFSQAATQMGERTAEFHHAADGAAHATTALNTTMHSMLEGLSEASRLTDAARQSADQAVLAANETAGAVRETTRNAVFEAKRAAQFIRAEAASMQEAAADTLAKLNEAARSARDASEESQAAADRHAASIEKRLAALAATAGAKKAPVVRSVERIERLVERVAERKLEPVMAEASTLHMAANAAVARGGSRGATQALRVGSEPKRMFKGFGWGAFMSSPRLDETPVAANESYELVDFSRPAPNQEPKTIDAALKVGALDLVTDAGVNLEDVLAPSALERIAISSRNGATARRRTVSELAPAAVSRVARHVQRNEHALELATQFRSRPDLAKSEKKGEGSDLVRAYLLIDAALS
jgi:methyl-accepting chemotaxis protein